MTTRRYFEKKSLGLVLALVIVMSLTALMPLKARAATFEDINDSSVFFKQNTSVRCVLAANAMMLRRYAMARGDSNWSAITQDSIASVATTDGASVWYSYSVSNTGTSISVSHAYLPGGSANTQKLIDLLGDHVEGIVIYYTGQPHAVLLTDYTNGTFYCADPANGTAAGRIPLSSAFTVSATNVTEYWYVSSPKVSLNNDQPGKPSVNNLKSAYKQDETVTFTWKATENTTHYNIWFEKKNDSGSWTKLDHTFYVESGFTKTFSENGYYRVQLQSTNSNAWTEDHSTWAYTDGDWQYFSVGMVMAVMENGSFPSVLVRGMTPSAAGTVHASDSITWAWMGVMENQSWDTMIDSGAIRPKSNTWDIAGEFGKIQAQFAELPVGEYTFRVDCIASGIYFCPGIFEFSVVEKTDIGGSQIRLSTTVYEYDGSARKPAVTVICNGKTLVSGTDYTVSYTNNVNVGTAKVTVTGKGLYTGTVTATYAIKAAQKQLPFTDVTRSKTYYDAVYWAYFAGIVKGKSETRFAPGDSLTRGEFCTMLWRMFGKPAVSDKDVSSMPFADAKKSNHKKAIAWCYKNGVISGYKVNGKQVFKPSNTITRGNIIVMLFKLAKQEKSYKPATIKNPYTDVKSTNKNISAYKWAYQNGVVTTKKLGPSTACKRWEMVSYLYGYNNAYAVKK